MMAEPRDTQTDHTIDRAANDSPRSGSSKRLTPMVWGVIVVAIVVLTIWFAIRL